MNSVYLMAVDLGTSFVKIGVYDTDANFIGGSKEAVRQEKVQPGVYLQKADLILESVITCIQNTVKVIGSKAASVAAIVFTGQMAGFMGVGKNWEDITTWSCSLDNRYLPIAKDITRQYHDLILEESGTNSPVMAPKIKWFAQDYPDQSRKIKKYMMISSFILGQLGEIDLDDATIDHTYLEWTGLANIKKGTWSKDLLQVLNVRDDQLPNIVNSDSVCGHLSAKMAALCGLKSGIPLVSGAGDKPAGCLGAAIVEPGETILEAASYGGMSCCIKEYRPDFENRRLDVIPSAIPGDFYAHYYIAGSGITLDWFIQNFVVNSEVDNKAAFQIMDELVEKLKPGSDGLMAIGMLGGCAMPLDSEMRGLWIGHTWSHRKEHFYRALLESYSYEFTITLQAIDKLYPEYKGRPVNIIGGGAKSKVWTQMLSNVSGRTYQRINQSDVALWGAVIIAGKAIGLFDDMKEEAKKHRAVLDEYQTNLEYHAAYCQLLGRYKELLAKTGDCYKISRSI